MEKYNLNEGNESLKKILLMMKYDNKKTLSENTSVIIEDNNSQYNTYNGFKQCLIDATSGGGTDIPLLKGCFSKTPQNYFDDFIRTSLNDKDINGEEGLVALLNSELGMGNTQDAKDIAETFKTKKSKYNFQVNGGTFGVRSISIDEIVSGDLGLTELSKSFPCIVGDDNFKYLKKDNKGWYYFSSSGRNLAMKLDGTTAVLEGNKYKTLPDKAYCPESVVVENIIKEGIVIPGITNTNSVDTNDGGENKNQQKDEPKKDSVTNQPSTNSLNDIITTKSIVKKNAKGPIVKEIKTILKGKLPEQFTSLQIQDDETYDQKTVGLVAYYQALNNLKVDGIVGPETAASLSK